MYETEIKKLPPNLTELNARGLGRYLTLLCTLPLLLLASCSGDDEPAPLNPDGTRTVTITVSATDEMQTRAISETEDDAITRCLIQVMNGSTTEVAATAMTAGSNNTYTYTANLDRNSSYTFLFWADDGSYTASDLTGVTAGSTVGIAYATTASWNGTDASITANLQLVVSKVTLKTTTALPAGANITLQVPTTYSAYNVSTDACTGASAATTHTFTVGTGGVEAGDEVGSFYVLTDADDTQTLTLTYGGQTTVNDVALGPGKHLLVSGDIAGLAQTPVTLSAIISDSWDADYRGFGSVNGSVDF